MVGKVGLEGSTESLEDWRRLEEEREIHRVLWFPNYPFAMVSVIPESWIEGRAHLVQFHEPFPQSVDFIAVDCWWGL
jgi:hypothetical protein